jgi:hypothetical protein
MTFDFPSLSDKRLARVIEALEAEQERLDHLVVQAIGLHPGNDDVLEKAVAGIAATLATALEEQARRFEVKAEAVKRSPMVPVDHDAARAQAAAEDMVHTIGVTADQWRSAQAIARANTDPERRGTIGVNSVLRHALFLGLGLLAGSQKMPSLEERTPVHG